MRRWLALLSVAAVLTGAGGGAYAYGTSSAGTAGTAAAAAACRVSSSSARCCLRSGSCRFELTINTAPNPGRAGAPVKISGRLVGLRAGGVKVTLRQRLSAQRRFHSIAATATDGTGAYEIQLPTVRSNASWHVIALGRNSRDRFRNACRRT